MRRAVERLKMLSIRAQVLGIVLAMAIPLAGVIVAQGVVDADHQVAISSAAPTPSPSRSPAASARTSSWRGDGSR